MTDLTLSQFQSLSKQELHRLLKQEEFEIHGDLPASRVRPATRSFSARLLRLISLGVRVPRSLHKRVFPNLRLNSRF